MPTTEVNEAVREFEVRFDESEITEMRRRISATRWAERETVDDDSQGVPLATMHELARYWIGRLGVAAATAPARLLRPGVSERVPNLRS
jgi:Epoxide hydrolase N terminus